MMQIVRRLNRSLPRLLRRTAATRRGQPPLLLQPQNLNPEPSRACSTALRRLRRRRLRCASLISRTRSSARSLAIPVPACGSPSRLQQSSLMALPIISGAPSRAQDSRFGIERHPDAQTPDLPFSGRGQFAADLRTSRPFFPVKPTIRSRSPRQPSRLRRARKRTDTGVVRLRQIAPQKLNGIKDGDVVPGGLQHLDGRSRKVLVGEEPHLTPRSGRPFPS
jgi:hypothetical protein